MKPKRPRMINRNKIFASVSQYEDNTCQIQTDFNTTLADAKRLRDWLDKYIAWREADRPATLGDSQNSKSSAKRSRGDG